MNVKDYNIPCKYDGTGLRIGVNTKKEVVITGIDRLIATIDKLQLITKKIENFRLHVEADNVEADNVEKYNMIQSTFDEIKSIVNGPKEIK